VGVLVEFLVYLDKLVVQVVVVRIVILLVVLEHQVKAIMEVAVLITLAQGLQQEEAAEQEAQAQALLTIVTMELVDLE
jgi:hypothetical protein